jgi:ABC-type branched-subunit amino acid transport system ATPase component
MLKIRNLISGYTKNNDILKGINLTLAENEVVAIIGQNGSGKSTLAKSIMGMVPYLNGEINCNGSSLIGKSISQISDLGIGFFMQGGRIFPNLTVEENLDFVCSGLNRKDTFERKKNIKENFDLFKSNSKSKLKASYLSGGEKHQLNLAMVLIKEPSLLILDEPSAGLSPSNRKDLYDILYSLKSRFTKGILLIEQNISSGIEISNRIILLQNGNIASEIESKDFKTLNKIDELFFANKN